MYMCVRAQIIIVYDYDYMHTTFQGMQILQNTVLNCLCNTLVLECSHCENILNYMQCGNGSLLILCPSEICIHNCFSTLIHHCLMYVRDVFFVVTYSLVR